MDHRLEAFHTQSIRKEPESDAILESVAAKRCGCGHSMSLLDVQTKKLFLDSPNAFTTRAALTA